MEKIHYSRSEYRNQYLRSEEWKLKRSDILKRDPICRICDKNKSHDVHHLTYQRLHHERDTDLIGICRSCHTFIHKYRELSSVTHPDRLKIAVAYAKQSHRFTKEMLSALTGNAKLLVAGILRHPATLLNEFVGRLITYGQERKISALLGKQIKLRKPNKKRSVRRIRKPFSRL